MNLERRNWEIILKCRSCQGDGKMENWGHDETPLPPVTCEDCEGRGILKADSYGFLDVICCYVRAVFY